MNYKCLLSMFSKRKMAPSVSAGFPKMAGPMLDSWAASVSL